MSTALEAEAAGKSGLRLREAAERQFKAKEYCEKAARCYQEGNRAQAFRWFSAGDAYYKSAEKLGEAIVADENKNPEKANSLRGEAKQKLNEALEWEKKAK